MCIVSCRDLPVVKAEPKSQALDIPSVPKDMVLLFFSYLNAQELCVVSCVQKQWSLLAKTEDLWKNLVTCNLGFEIKLTDMQCSSWKENYKKYLDIFIVRKIALMAKENDSEYSEVSTKFSRSPWYQADVKDFYLPKLKVIELRIRKDILNLAKKMSADFKKRHFNLTELASNSENYPIETVRLAKEIMEQISILVSKNQGNEEFFFALTVHVAPFLRK